RLFLRGHAQEPGAGARPGHDHRAGRAQGLHRRGRPHPTPGRLPRPLPDHRHAGRRSAMTDLTHLESVIETAWEARAEVSPATRGEVRDAVDTALALLDSGQARVASRGEDGVWSTHQWLKKAVLLSFRLNDNVIM